MITDNDKQRIEQEAKKNMRKYYGTEANFLRDSTDPDYELTLFKAGAEYATIFERQQQANSKSDTPLGERFMKEFGTRSDYFNHRLGLFMDMKDWIVKEVEAAQAPDLLAEVSELEQRLETSYKGFDQLEALKHSINLDREALRAKVSEQEKEIERLKNKYDNSNQEWLEETLEKEEYRQQVSEQSQRIQKIEAERQELLEGIRIRVDFMPEQLQKFFHALLDKLNHSKL